LISRPITRKGQKLAPVENLRGGKEWLVVEIES